MQTNRDKLYSCCCKAIKEGVLSKCVRNTTSRLHSGAVAEGFGTAASRQKRRPGSVCRGGVGRLCWNLSKANNHSGAGKEY